MGFGHRVYKNYDPRASVMRNACHEVLDAFGKRDEPVLELAMELEKIALSDDYFISHKLFPNVDFYSGIILQAIGFPTSMFTVLFAVARTVGWVAQWKEMIEDPTQRIGRPRQLYTGYGERPYVPIKQRQIIALKVDAVRLGNEKWPPAELAALFYVQRLAGQAPGEIVVRISRRSTSVPVLENGKMRFSTATIRLLGRRPGGPIFHAGTARSTTLRYCCTNSALLNASGVASLNHRPGGILLHVRDNFRPDIGESAVERADAAHRASKTFRQKARPGHWSPEPRPCRRATGRRRMTTTA